MNEKELVFGPRGPVCVWGGGDAKSHETQDRDRVRRPSDRCRCVGAHTHEGSRTVEASEEMVPRDLGQSAAPHVVKAAAATKATLMLLLTR